MRVAAIGYAVVACGMLAAPGSASAASDEPVHIVAVQRVRGKCTETLHTGEIPREQSCLSVVFYMEFSDGMRGVAFSNGSNFFSFVGKGTSWSQKSGGRIDVSLLSSGSGKNAADFPAKGYCRFDNLHAGKEVAIACAATMKAGHWSAAFRTDGKPPVEMPLKD